ncbi:MAG: formylglycine-generating enzyme family protein [Bacteroidales bacterium]|nr:formylglycine-generating enzyme family protein [Bacteroidales bacterium]
MKKIFVAIMVFSIVILSGCQKYTITVEANNDLWGEVSGSGTYTKGTALQITATANKGYEFIQWNDGNVDNPRQVVANANFVYTAVFANLNDENSSNCLVINTGIAVVDDLANTMVKVEGGSFLMGANEEDKYAYCAEKPQHQVTVSDFYICKHEVTQELWKAVMDSCPNYKGGWSETYGIGDNYPAYFISWNDCQLFIAKLNEMTGLEFRLPTEAEWEYAARGGNKSQGYIFAGNNTLDDIAWYVKNSEGKNHIVMQKQANELGLYDMSGNVWEWCNDWYGSNYYAESNNSIDPKGPLADTIISSLDYTRVIRGGAWDYYTRFCRLSYRNGYYIEDRDCNLGFRLVCSPIK